MRTGTPAGWHCEVADMCTSYKPNVGLM